MEDWELVYALGVAAFVAFDGLAAGVRDTHFGERQRAAQLILALLWPLSLLYAIFGLVGVLLGFFVDACDARLRR